MAKMPVYNLEWQEPPAADQAIIDMILAQLQNNPGRWARLLKGVSTTSHVSKWLKLGAEAKHVRVNPGESPARYDIYARWPQHKAATISNAIRAEVAKSTAAVQPPSKIREAVATGHAITPAPTGGGYLAGRAARGINPEGTMP